MRENNNILELDKKKFFCLKCNEFICQECKKYHSIKNGMSDKNVLIASILDAFVNTYKKNNLSPEEIKENKKVELSLKLQAVLAKYNGDKDKMKKELGKNPIDFKKMENDSDDNDHEIKPGNEGDGPDFGNDDDDSNLGSDEDGDGKYDKA